VTGILRFVGIINAAIWFGGSFFFTVVSGRLPFSESMKALLGQAYYPYFSGAIAQLGISYYFSFQIVCGVVALLHLAAEWMYQPRRNRRSLLALLILLFGFTLMEKVWLVPKMKELHAAKYARNYPQTARDAADRSFRVWHASSQVINLFVLGGLVVYVLRMSQTPDVVRFARPASQIRS
jgi:hypothetical protein